MKHIILLAGLLLILPFPALALHNITGAEYYIDTDPGEGNGTPLTFKQGILLKDDFDGENGGIGEFNYTRFTNWDVPDGAVDLVGDRVLAFDGTVLIDFDFWSGNGRYVDLDGTTDKAGTLSSKTAFVLKPGQYVLSFRLAGSNRGDTNTITVSLGSLYTEQFTKTSEQGFEKISRTISVASETTAKLTFTHDSTAQDQYGLLLDNVLLYSKNAGAWYEFEQEITLPANIKAGPHFLCVRMQNESGVWGISRRHLFMVKGTKTIQAAEYFIDTDPGAGSGIPLTLSEGLYQKSGIDTSSLAAGIRTVFVRMKDSEGTWGVPRKFDVEVSSPVTLKSAEYFLDTDPGAGSGTALTATDGQFDSVQEYFEGEQDSSSLNPGNHTLTVRAMDSYSRWGQAETVSIEVNPSITGKITASVAGWDSLSVRNAEVALDGTDYKTFTDENGNFILSDVPAGTYTLTVNAPNFQILSQQITWTGEQGLTVDVPSLSSADGCEIPGDFNGDGVISLEEAIHALQVVSGVKQ